MPSDAYNAAVSALKQQMQESAGGPPPDLATTRAGFEQGYSSMPVPDGVSFEPVDAGGVSAEWVGELHRWSRQGSEQQEPGLFRQQQELGHDALDSSHGHCQVESPGPTQRDQRAGRRPRSQPRLWVLATREPG